MSEKIILDVDTGSDDAVAIMTAILSPDIDLVAICTVAGNKDVEKTTENTLRVVETLGADVPVYKGVARPLVKELTPRVPATHRSNTVVDGRIVNVHEDYLDLPPATIKVQDTPAAAFYVDYLRGAPEPVTLVPVGPLTNLALALLMDASIVRNIKRIVIMGGGREVANATPAAEFNVWADAEAAAWVLQSGADILWVPLDATHAAYLTKDDCERLRAINTLESNFAADLVEQRIVVHDARQPLSVRFSAAVHDALAVCAVIDESVLRDVRCVHMDIGLSDYAEGQTIVDPRHEPGPINCSFAFDGDPVRFADMLCEIFTRA
ncbi:MAG: nucleoside hydrolase [Clostridiales bacterium]|jgi:inosine-uridine nucleoside N-ribohydrolase|nr:nucleoside hydrolase [Clostridiales bacterium]